MQMNKFKQLMLINLPMLILLSVITDSEHGSVVDKQQPVPANPVPVTEEPRQTPAEPETDSGAKPTPTAPARATKPIKNFKPSETIGADSAVAFPIDI